MTTAQEILKMIEEVSPDDVAGLDAVDLMAAFYLQGQEPQSALSRLMLKPYPQYTRSRDALKAIRPEGWTWVANTQDQGCHFNFYSPNPNHMRRLSRVMPSEYLPTEELAELHAIIQAIAYEREQGGAA